MIPDLENCKDFHLKALNFFVSPYTYSVNVIVLARASIFSTMLPARQTKDALQCRAHTFSETDEGG